MTQFRMMDREVAQEIAAIASRALQEAFKGWGLSVTVDGGTYGAYEFKPRVVFTVGDGTAQARKDFEEAAWSLGLQKSDFGRVYDSPKYGPLEICGVNLRARKSPILVKDSKGKVFKASANFIHHKLGYPYGGYRRGVD